MGEPEVRQLNPSDQQQANQQQREAQFPCEQCGKVCRSSAGLNTHTRAKHQETLREESEAGDHPIHLSPVSNRNAREDSEDSSSSTITSLEPETLVQTRDDGASGKENDDEEEFPFMCDLCYKGFKTELVKKAHMQCRHVDHRELDGTECLTHHCSLQRVGSEVWWECGECRDCEVCCECRCKLPTGD